MLRSLAESLNRHELWIVALLTAAAMLETRLLFAACLVAALFWPLRKLATGAWSRRTPADLPVALLLVGAGISLLVTALPEITIPQVLRLLNGIALFYAIVNWSRTGDRMQALAAAAVLLGIALGAAAFFTVDWIDDKFAFIPSAIYNRIPNLASDAVHPNVLGGALLLFAPLSAAIFLWGDPERRWMRWLGGLALAWMAGVMVLSQSRGALLGLSAAVLALVVLRWRWGWLILLAAGLGAGWLVSEVGSHSMADLLFGSGVFGGFRGRVEIWGRGIFMLQDFPFTGIGMGLFPVVVERIYPFFSPSDVAVLHAHNLFVQVGVDLGLPGLVAWLAVFLLVAWSGGRLYRGGGRYAGIGAGILAVQLALAVHGLFDAVTWGQVRSAPLVWVVWGFAFSLWTLHEKKHVEK